MLVNCVECEREISKRARLCPHCGHPCYRGYEWRSEAEIFGWPLIHIAAGRDRKTGQLKVAKGVIAIGQFGIGLITIAHVGVGLLFGLGQVMCGFMTVGQISIGMYFGLGQIATGMIAIGQICLGKYVLGQLGLGLYAWTSQARDPQAVEFFTELWDYIKSLAGKL